MTLGSIVVRLTMNTADFDTDSKRAASIAEKRAKEIDASFRKAGVAIGLALGAIAVGITSALKGAIDTMDETYNAAKKVGDSTENFSRLVYAAGLADVGMDQLVTTMGKLTKSQAAALDVGSAQGKMFKALGIDVTDATGKLRDSSDVLLDFADRFKAMKGSPEAMAAGFALFGRSFQDMIPLLEQGSEEIRRLMGESDELGRTITDEAGAAADQFKDDLEKLQGAMNGVWMEVASKLLPQLIELTEQMLEWVKEGDNAAKTADVFATSLEGIGTFAAATTNLISGLAQIVGGFVEQAWGFYKVVAGLLSLDMSTLKSGWGNMQAGGAGMSGGFGQIVDPKNQGLFARQQYAQYSGPLLAGNTEMGRTVTPGSGRWANVNQSQAEYDASVRRVLGGDDPKGKGRGGGKSKAAELTDEQKAAKALNDEYVRTAEGLRERLGLMGLETEAAKMKWETEEGSFKALDPLRKAELIAQAGLVDAKQKAMDLAEDERRAAEEAQKSYQAAIADIQTERDTLGMTNEQLEIYNRLKWAGVDANSAFGKSIVEQSQDLQKARKAMGQQIEAMDAFRQEGSNFLQDLGNGVKPIDALTNALDSLREKLLQMISDNLMEQFFGQMGSSSTGSSGGGIWDMLGGLFGSFLGAGSGGGATASAGGGQYSWIGAGYARGGWTGPGGMNERAGDVHREEVVWSRGDVARAGGVGAVESMRRGGGGRGSVVVNQTITVPANTSYDTAVQAGQLAYAGAGRAARRNG